MKNITVKQLKQILENAEDDNEKVFVFCNNQDKITMTINVIEECKNCDGEGTVENIYTSFQGEVFEDVTCNKCDGKGFKVIEKEVFLGINNKVYGQGE